MFDITRLKDIRRRLGLTQHQFAEHAGVSQSLIAKIESRQIDPSYSNVVKIEEAVNLLSKQKEPAAKSIMTKRVISVQSDLTALKVVDLMKKHNISQVPVFDKVTLVGLVSESSILERDVSKIRQLKAQDLMQEAPPVVSEETRLSIISALLKQFPLVLIQKNKEFVGVITKADVLRSVV